MANITLNIEGDLNIYAVFFEFPYRGQAVYGVAGKAAHALSHNQVDFPGKCVINHGLETDALFYAGPADPFVGCCTERTNKFTPYRIPGARFPSEL